MIISLIAEPSPDDGLPPQCRHRHPGTLNRCELQEHPADIPHWIEWINGKGYTWTTPTPKETTDV